MPLPLQHATSTVTDLLHEDGVVLHVACIVVLALVEAIQRNIFIVVVVIVVVIIVVVFIFVTIEVVVYRKHVLVVGILLDRPGGQSFICVVP